MASWCDKWNIMLDQFTCFNFCDYVFTTTFRPIKHNGYKTREIKLVQYIFLKIITIIMVKFVFTYVVL